MEYIYLKLKIMNFKRGKNSHSQGPWYETITSESTHTHTHIHDKNMYVWVKQAKKY